MNASPVVAGTVAFLVAGALVPLLVRFAVGRNLFDVPNPRSSHEVPTPRLGGVAMMAATWVGYSVMLFMVGTSAYVSWPLLAAATLMWAVGLADDLSGGLGFKVKAAAQAISAAALLALYPPQIIAAAPGLPVKITVFLVGILWIVALCNAFNFMDGIDGITGGVAVISALFLTVLAGDTGSLLPALAGATLGFLIWNMSPASTFCGDSGSYFLGFVACVLVFTPYLFDTAFTLVSRLRAGKDVFSAHREHIYQRITPGPAMHRRTSNLYYAATALSGLSALLVATGGIAHVVVGASLALACCGGLAALPIWLARGR